MRIRNVLAGFVLAVVAWVGLLSTPAGAQQVVRLYGTVSGAPIALLATAGGVLRTSLDGGSIPASTCAAPALGLSGTPTTGIAFSTTSGVVLCNVGLPVFYNSNALYNVAVGLEALKAPTTGQENTAVGVLALYSNTGGSENVGVGTYANYANLVGIHNTAVGYLALRFNTANGQTAVGRHALFTHVSGIENTAVGSAALDLHSTGEKNTAVGGGALSQNVSGEYNTVLGHSAGRNLTGSSNIAIGYNVQAMPDGSSNTLNIGNLLFGTGVDGTAGTLSTGSAGIGTLTPGGRWTVAHHTLGGNVLVAQTTATNDDPTETVFQNRVATTDATVTTVQAVTIPTSTNTVISCYVTARRTGGAAGAAEDGGGYALEVVVKNTTGTVAELAAETVRTIGESQAGWNVTSAPSGATELIQVTGAVDNNVTWHTTCRTWPVSS